MFFNTCFSPKRPSNLFQVCGWHFFTHANLPFFYAVDSVMESSEKLIPNHPKLAKVDLRILVLFLVMPAVDFGYTENIS
jgi:hypothetical protein